MTPPQLDLEPLDIRLAVRRLGPTADLPTWVQRSRELAAAVEVLTRAAHTFVAGPGSA